MASITIRNIDAGVKEQLRVRAARNGRSMESEMRHILSETFGKEKKRQLNLAEAIRQRFLPLGGVDDLKTHPPVAVGKPPKIEP